VADLIPEKRLDRNGHLVTKHVRAGVAAGGSASLPAPVLASPAQASLPKGFHEQRKWNGNWHGKHAFREVVAATTRGYAYGEYTFECSDAEAYDVLSVSHGRNATLLLSEGIRSKNEALAFYTAHGLEEHIVDNSEWLDQAIARGIPAQPTIEIAGFYGVNGYRDYPQFLDALEANGVRVLREAVAYYPTVPDLIMKGEISLSDIRSIGASRFAKAARKGPAIRFLQKIQASTSNVGLEELKEIITTYEKRQVLHAIDPLTMAESYGAEVVLNLRYYNSAAHFLINFTSRHYSTEERGRIITYRDDLAHHSRGIFTFTNDDVFLLYDSGATVEQAVEGVLAGQTLLQVAAMAQSVPSSISTGWL
jgi:hypothetical protein